jgi:hypothetical protein
VREAAGAAEPVSATSAVDAALVETAAAEADGV